MNRDTLQMFTRLHDAGITPSDALALRRISMTLHRWHELECGGGNDHGSWCITRGRKGTVYTCTQCGHVGEGVNNCDGCGDPAPVRSTNGFMHDDDGKPYLEHHHYLHGKGKDTVTYSPLFDRERGAHKRLAAIMARYPELVSYVQTDPRGCALYILKRADVGDSPIDQVYSSRGIAVHK